MSCGKGDVSLYKKGDVSLYKGCANLSEVEIDSVEHMYQKPHCDAWT